jgi:copper chaperone CopZ
MTTILKVEGMSCGHCVAGVKAALEAVKGVESAAVTLEPGVAVIEHKDSTALSELIAVVEEEGYMAKAQG